MLDVATIEKHLARARQEPDSSVDTELPITKPSPRNGEPTCSHLKMFAYRLELHSLEVVLEQFSILMKHDTCASVASSLAPVSSDVSRQERGSVRDD